MHIAMGPFVIVMPVYIFQQGCARGKAAIEQWQRQDVLVERKVITLPRH